MNKLKNLLFLFLSIFVLTGCIRAVRARYYEDSNHQSLQLSPRGLPLIFLTEGAREIALADFDYLATIIMENAPVQLVVERRFDFTMAELLRDIRYTIYAMEPVESMHSYIMSNGFAFDSTDLLPTDDRELAAHYLSSLLFYTFYFQASLEGLGHLNLREFRDYGARLRVYFVYGGGGA